MKVWVKDSWPIFCSVCSDPVLVLQSVCGERKVPAILRHRLGDRKQHGGRGKLLFCPITHVLYLDHGIFSIFGSKF